MVPASTLFALTAAFFIREVIMRSKQKPTDFDNGYRQALRDIIQQWNTLAIARRYTSTEFLDCLKKFIERKQDEVK